MKNPSPKKVDAFPVLEPGDILLYGGGFIGALIQFRTWSDVSHVEIYTGGGRSVASRADGPGLFPLKIIGLRRVIRPVAKFNLHAGLDYFFSIADKLPYGYTDLLRFYLIDIPTNGLICSEFADLFFRHAGLELFNPEYPEGAVCPRDFQLLARPLAKQIWSWK